jgi:hypothetical protein
MYVWMRQHQCHTTGNCLFGKRFHGIPYTIALHVHIDNPRGDILVCVVDQIIPVGVQRLSSIGESGVRAQLRQLGDETIVDA